MNVYAVETSNTTDEAEPSDIVAGKAIGNELSMTDADNQAGAEVQTDDELKPTELETATQKYDTAPNGIAGNGTGGVWIDINAAPYTEKNYYDAVYNKRYIAYTDGGCTWFAASRAQELLNRYINILDGRSWYKTEYAKYGFTADRNISPMSFACYEGHISVIESVQGNTVIVSEGGAWDSTSANGYCKISQRTIDYVESSCKENGGTFLGYVHFGSGYTPTPVSYDPQGCFDNAEGTLGAIHVSGWAFDKDDANAELKIAVYVDGDSSSGTHLGNITANAERADVDDYYHTGIYHGFAGHFDTTLTGTHEVYVYALNIGGGQDVFLGHKTVDIPLPVHDPDVTFTSMVTGEEKVSISGTAVDLDDTNASLEIKVYANNTYIGSLYTNSRTHEFSGTILTDVTGNVTVTAYAISVGGGNDKCIFSTNSTIKKWDKCGYPATISQNGIYFGDNIGAKLLCDVDDIHKVITLYGFNYGDDSISATYLEIPSKCDVASKRITYRVRLNSSCQSYLAGDSIKKISFVSIDGEKVKAGAGFSVSGSTALESAELSGLDTSEVEDMSGMFAWCSELKSIDMSDWDTSNVTDMSNMFLGCSKLESLNLSNWDTGRVHNMHAMFSQCEKLKKLNLSSFDTENVVDMGWMFDGCKVLSELNIGSFNTAKVTDMQAMFGDCGSLTALDISGFDTSEVTDMSTMFLGCDKLNKLELSGFNTAKVKDFNCMLSRCSSLNEVDLSSFDFSSRQPQDWDDSQGIGVLSLETMAEKIITPKTETIPAGMKILLPALYKDANGNEYSIIDSSTPSQISISLSQKFQSAPTDISFMRCDKNVTTSNIDANEMASVSQNHSAEQIVFSISGALAQPMTMGFDVAEDKLQEEVNGSGAGTKAIFLHYDTSAGTFELSDNAIVTDGRATLTFSQGDAYALVYAVNGDVDGDNSVSVKDVQSALKHTTGRKTLTPLEVGIGDVSGANGRTHDNQVNISDVQKLLKYVSRRISGL